MTALPASTTITAEWVGQMQLEDETIFLKVNFGGNALAPSAVGLDLPERLGFDLPLRDLRLAPPQVSFSATAGGETYRFEGTLSAGIISGQAQMGEAKGDFVLTAVVPLSPAAFRPYLGDYEVDHQRVVTLGMSLVEDAPLFFYLEDDALVRLYPLSDHAFYSARGESLEMMRDSRGEIVGIVWGQMPFAPMAAPRQTWHQEVEVSFAQAASGSPVLVGTLLLPPKLGPHPAVILAHDIAPGERSFYRVFADTFVRHGIAALIYDRRGAGVSGGDSAATLFDLAEDMRAAYRFLQRQRVIKPDEIGLWGLGEGGWIAPLAAAGLPDARFVLTVNGSGVSPARQEALRCAAAVRALGASAAAVRLTEQAWELTLSYAAANRWSDQLEAVLNEVATDLELQSLPLPPHIPGLLNVIPRPGNIAEFKAAYGGKRPDAAYDPGDSFARLTCPLLCIIGGQDVDLPVEESVERLEAIFRDKLDASLKVYPDAGHFLNVIDPASDLRAQEAATHHLHAFRFAPGFLDLMTDWILTRVQVAV